MWTYPFGLLIAFCVGVVMGRAYFQPSSMRQSSECICGHEQCYHVANVGECYQKTSTGTCRCCVFTPKLTTSTHRVSQRTHPTEPNHGE